VTVGTGLLWVLAADVAIFVGALELVRWEL
jgi:hypothetical protein